MSSRRILLLEDDPVDAELMRSHLLESGLDAEFTEVSTREAYIQALHEQEYDLILSDYSLVGFDGFQAFDIAQATSPDTPFIIISGTLGEERAIESMHKGVTDYILKQNLIRLRPAVERALKLLDDQKTARSLESSLRRSQIEFSRLIDSIKEYAIVSLDLDGCIRSWNPGAERLFGYSESEVAGRSYAMFFTEEDRAESIPQKELKKTLKEGRANDERWHVRRVVRQQGGFQEQKFWANGVISLVQRDGKPEGFTKVLRDQTEQKLVDEEKERLAREVELERGRIESIVSTVPGVVWETYGMLGTPEHRCTFVSGHAVEMTGYTVEECIAPPLPGELPFWAKLIHPDDQERVVKEMQEIYHGDRGSLSCRWIAKDGRILWVESHIIVIKDERDTSIGCRGVTMDITDRYNAQQERDTLLSDTEVAREEVSELLRTVEENELRYRSMAEAMPVIVWTNTVDGKLVYINQRWSDFTGVDQPESLEKGFKYFVHPEDYDRVIDTWRQSAVSGEPYESEYRLRREDGQYEWFLGRSVPVRDANGTIVQWVGTATALDEQKRAREGFKFLAETTSILASSLDYETTLKSVAQLSVPRIADWCAVDIVNPEGNVERLAVAHVDPAKIRLAEDLQEKYPTDPNAPTGVPNVIRTGKSEFYPHLPEDLLRKAAKDEEHWRIIESIGFTSAITVPLLARGFVLGAITLVSAESGRRYTEHDLALAEDLGKRAGTAIDNAWLYRKAQEEIEERKRVEEAVRLSETRFRTLIEQSPLSVQLFSLDGYCLQANRAWAELFDSDIEQLKGYNVLQDPQLDQKGIRQYMQRAFEGETVSIPPVEYDPADIGKKGRPRWVRAFAYPVRDAEGSSKEIALILEDVTDRIEAEADLREAKEAAEAANQSKDKFLAILSHELRTPLTPVLTTVQALEMDEDFPEQYREWLELIHRNVELEARLIDDLLDITRIAKGKLKLNIEPTNLHRLIEHVIDIYSPEIGAKGLTFSKDLQAKNTLAEVDPARLQQVIWNLLKNAVKFTPRGGSISIETSDTEAGIRLSVRDTGIGIDDEVLPRIFEAFEQGEQTVTRHFGGLGLGLAISKSLVDMHGGSISATSNGRNNGSVFSVELAAKPDPAGASGSAFKRAVRPKGNDESRHVLLVDDHLDTSLALKMLLERRGYQIQTAATVREALDAVEWQLAKGQQFDLVISDIGLPDASGLELMETLKNDHPSLLAIALSGFGTDEDIRRSKDAGFQEHLTKPFSFQKLEEIVRRLLPL